MHRILILITFTLTVGPLLPVQQAFASRQADLANNQAVIAFPTSISFQATINADANINSVVLEYGTNQLTCGEVVAKAFPQFDPGTNVNVEWTWEMRQSGSLPPGAQIWWRWRYSEESGRESVSDLQTITWLDAEHDWRAITADNLNLHWYFGNESFAVDLLNTAKHGLDFNRTRSGLTSQSPIDLYIYADTEDLRNAVLYEPSWTGGQAFPAHDIVIIGIAQSDLDWGQDAIVHELTHVLVGHLTFSCLGSVPTWLNEGLAMYSEGELDASYQSQLENAVEEDTLLPVRSLNTGFSEVPNQAYLSYSQSYSLVKFLIESYGQNKMTSLLVSLRDGETIDNALLNIYEFNVEGLEDEWRKSIQAQPRSVSAQPTVLPTPIFVNTIVPFSGGPLTNQISTPTPVPTSSFSESTRTETPPRGRPPFWLTAFLIGTCCIMILLMGVVVLGFVTRRNNRKGGDNVQ